MAWFNKRSGRLWLASTHRHSASSDNLILTTLHRIAIAIAIDRASSTIKLDPT